MACHEIAALRLGLMSLIGIKDDAEKAHELAELGDAAEKPGPIKALCAASDLKSLERNFAASLADLESRVATAKPGDPKLAYWRTLIVLTKKVELDLQNQIESVTRLYKNLDEMHDLVHEMYPAD